MLGQIMIDTREDEMSRGIGRGGIIIYCLKAIFPNQIRAARQACLEERQRLRAAGIDIPAELFKELDRTPGPEKDIESMRFFVRAKMPMSSGLSPLASHSLTRRTAASSSA